MSRRRARTHTSALPAVLLLIGMAALGASACGPSSPAAYVPERPRRLACAGGPSTTLFDGLEGALARASPELGRGARDRPHFMAAATTEIIEHQSQYTLGRLVSRKMTRHRWGLGQVRTGTPSLDGAGAAGHPVEALLMPWRPRPTTMERTVFETLERAHHERAEELARMRTWLAKHPVKDRPPDWSPARTQSHIERSAGPCQPPRYPRSAMERASEVFRRYPDIHHSELWVQTASWATHTVSSESIRLFRQGMAVTLWLHAETRAPDGMPLELQWRVQTPDTRQLPDPTILARQASTEAELLSRLRDAPAAMEAWSGPVLFEEEAATATLLSAFGALLTANRNSAYSGLRASAEERLGRPILPEWLSVVDDPTIRSRGGLPLRGHYAVDDEGVRARRVPLVSKGVLKALLCSRQPTRSQRASTGHGRYLSRALDIHAMPSNLLFLPTVPLSGPALRQRLLSLMKSRGLSFAHIVRRVRYEATRLGYRMLARTHRLGSPTLVYRLDATGRETLVRGYSSLELDTQEDGPGRKLLAMGGAPRVDHWLVGGGNWISVKARAFILDGVRLQTLPPHDHEAPPLSPPP